MGKVATCTVSVKGNEGGGLITINVSDFDASIHKKMMAKKAVEVDTTADVDTVSPPPSIKKRGK
jgi:hypothetical protein